MSATNQNFYSQKFYDYTLARSLHSADRVTRIITDFFQPKTVCDVGCGEGVWLAAYKKRGVKAVKGIDGDYVDRARLKIAPKDFISCDLSKPFCIDGQYDLIQSLEVAEHLPPEQSENFIAALAGHANVIVFSAAVPGQGGMYHINERPLELWRDLLRQHGYLAYDLVRGKIAQDKKIAPWYRYNMLVYIADTASADILTRAHAYKIPEDKLIPEMAPLWYRGRRRLISALPFSVQQRLAELVS